MHVGLVLYGSLDTRTGGYLYDRKLLEGLHKLGDSVQVFSLPWRAYIRRLGDNLSLTFQRRLEDASLDVLLQDELNHPSLVLLNRRLKKRIRCPTYSIVHHLRSSEPHLWPLKKLYGWVEARYLESVDGFICNSQATWRSVCGLVAEPSAHVVAPPGRDHIQPRIQPTAISSRMRSPGPLEILFLGAISPRKGLRTLLEALALTHGGWRLSIAGDPNRYPKYVRDMRRFVREQKLAPRVTFHGELPDGEVSQLMGRAHILCVPSSYEGFGIVFLEAMGFGMVPIGGTRGGTSELIDDGKTGYLIDPGDARSLAGTLRRLSQDRALLERLALEAHRRFLQHATWEDSVGRIRSFLARETEIDQVRS